jgi:hypothetical protein
VVVTDVLARKPRRGATATLVRNSVVALALGVPAWGAYAFWSHDHALRTDWDIHGPPCPPATHSWAEVAHSRQPRSFDYRPMHLEHLFGGAFCAEVPDGPFLTRRGYQVCQFTAPAFLSVTAGGRTTAFEPGYGRRATVTLRRGRIACVIGGWFTL